MQVMESTLALKPRADITRSPKQGYKWSHRKDSCPPIFEKIICKVHWSKNMFWCFLVKTYRHSFVGFAHWMANNWFPLGRSSWRNSTYNLTSKLQLEDTHNTNTIDIDRTFKPKKTYIKCLLDSQKLFMFSKRESIWSNVFFKNNLQENEIFLIRISLMAYVIKF